jgi:hypothetical protein
MAEWFKAAVLPARGGSAFGGKTAKGGSGLIRLVFIFYIAEAQVDFMLVRVEGVALMGVSDHIIEGRIDLQSRGVPGA